MEGLGLELGSLLFSLLASPFPPETPDTQAKVTLVQDIMELRRRRDRTKKGAGWTARLELFNWLPFSMRKTKGLWGCPKFFDEDKTMVQDYSLIPCTSPSIFINVYAVTAANILLTEFRLYAL